MSLVWIRPAAAPRTASHETTRSSSAGFFYTNSVLASLIVVNIWREFPFAMIMLTAGLQTVPEQLLRAAKVDGANAWQRFWKITLPLISNVLFFTFVMLTIFSLNIFTEPMVMFPPQVFGGQMGPQDSALFYVLYLFDQAFRNFRMGYASALAWVLFIVTLIVVTIQVQVSRRLVYTESN